MMTAIERQKYVGMIIKERVDRNNIIIILINPHQLGLPILFGPLAFRQFIVNEDNAHHHHHH